MFLRLVYMNLTGLVRSEINLSQCSYLCTRTQAHKLHRPAFIQRVAFWATILLFEGKIRSWFRSNRVSTMPAQAQAARD